MKRRFVKPGLGVASICVMFGVGVPAVLAATDSDTGLTPKSSKIALAKGTKLTITVKKDGANVLTGKKLTCTGSTSNLTMGTTGFKIAMSKPTFAGCKDTLKSTDKDTIKAGGTWSATYKDASDESGEVRGAGDKIIIKVPKNGLVAVSTFATSCAIFVNPKGTDRPVKAGYQDNSGGLSISNAPISYAVGNAPHQSKACPVAGDTGTAVLSAKYVANPVVADN